MRIFTILFILIPFLSQAQFAESIRTGRPGQSIGAYCLGKSVFQVQSGFTRNEISENSYSENIHTQSNVLRLGISEHFEISGVLNYSNRRIKEESIQTGISSTQLGARVNFTTADKWLPAIALQSRVLLPLQSEDYDRDEIGLKTILATVNKISNRFTFISNWIQTIPGGEADYIYNYSCSLGIGLGEKWGTFIEVYGRLDEFNTNYDTGISYLVNKNLQLDASIGQQSQDNIDDYFIDFGFSWRTNWRK